MDDTTEAQLAADMKEKGPEGTGPVDTCQLPPVTPHALPTRYTIDGSHRLKLAKKLGWTYLFEIFHPEIKTEEDARLFNYRRDAERGSIDPFRLAKTFKWFSDKGIKQEEIAKRFGVDVTTVSRRLSLNNVDPGVKQQAITDTRMSLSALEPISTLRPDLQRKALNAIRHGYEYTNAGQVSTRFVEERVQEIKKEDARLATFNGALATSKFKICPVCGKKPRIPRYGEAPFIECQSGDYEHTWSLESGKLKNPPAPRAKPGSRKEKAPVPQHVKTQHTAAQFIDAGFSLAKQIFPKLDHLSSFAVEGKIGSSPVSVSVTRGYKDQYTSIAIDIPREKYSFQLIPARGKKPDFASYLEGDEHVDRPEQLKALEKAAEKFLQTYGKLPRGKTTKSADLKRKQKG